MGEKTNAYRIFMGKPEGDTMRTIAVGKKIILKLLD
jgi:hypothetical protein